MKKVFVILTICFMSVFTATAQSVGYVDTEKILSCIQEYIDAQNELNNLAEKYKAEIQKDVDAIDALYRDYMGKKASLSAASQQAKENEIIAKEKAVKEKEENYFGENGVLTKRSTKLISPIQEVVEDAIKKVAESRGCSMVLDVTVTTGIVYKNSKYDLTDAVINYLR
ncbi:MAG: OmpH family outer membrane protein [Bacteroidales bacterium]|nr:OmpH family outer membrane protein [Bacteroidales bacterium]